MGIRLATSLDIREESIYGLLDRLQAEALALRPAIAILEGTAPDDLPTVKSKEYEDLGITAATKRFLRETGEPQHTRTIADALRQRGLKTSSNKFIATVHATLSNAKASFRRTDDGRWALPESVDRPES